MPTSATQPSRERHAQPAGGDIVDQTADSVLKLLQAGAPRGDLLASLTTAAELVSGSGAVASILVFDPYGLHRNGDSPNLPADYLDAIDRLKPDANVGTCASAAATGSAVITPDFRADDKWGELRHLPLALGFVGAWSMPIKSTDGRVLGTFGTYFRESRRPTIEEMRAVERLAAVAALVLVRQPFA
jgi:hypothetical protein